MLKPCSDLFVLCRRSDGQRFGPPGNVIRKEGQVDIQVSVGGEVINVDNEEERGEDSSLRDTSGSRDRF
jgi:hypothetical protein